MLHGRCSNSKIRYLHGRYLRLIYYDKFPSDEDLLTRRDQFLFITKTPRILLSQCLKLKAVSLLWWGLRSLWYKASQRLYFFKLIYHGSRVSQYSGPKNWDIYPPEIKQINSVFGFKKSIRKWIPAGCRCRLCRPWFSEVGLS